MVKWELNYMKLVSLTGYSVTVSQSENSTNLNEIEEFMTNNK